jgi:hypothetical protein
MRFVFDTGLGFKRSNLTSHRPDVAHTVRLRRFRLDTEGAHNAKIMLGWMPTDWRFTHGDNNDLVHWASAPRVVLFVPVRHHAHSDPNNAGAYHISPYGGQTISVAEYKPGELIRYEWYRGGPGKLDPHVLFDLYPYCGGDNDLKPGVNHPMFRFEVGDGGRWQVWIERDGRDGLAGGDRDGDWDMTFTEKSKEARPYTVDLGKAEKRAFGLSVYCPSADARGAVIDLDVAPYRLATGKPVNPGRRRVMATDVKLADLPKMLESVAAESAQER